MDRFPPESALAYLKSLADKEGQGEVEAEMDPGEEGVEGVVPGVVFEPVGNEEDSGHGKGPEDEEERPLPDFSGPPLAPPEKEGAKSRLERLRGLGVNVETQSKAKKKRPSSNRFKYSCPACSTNVWGKPDLNIVCGDCEVPFMCLDG